MLSARPTNINAIGDTVKQTTKTGKSKSNQNKIQNTVNTRKGGGLKVADPNRVPLANKPKPLHASTNTIHSQQQQKFSANSLKCDKNLKGEADLVKKKAQGTSSENKPTIDIKIDENDVNPFITNSYNPLHETCPFDEELYQKVLKLEIDDDGFPVFDSDEPFDF